MMKLILIAAVYGSLVGGDLVRAPYAVRTNEGTTETAALSEAEANAVGYKLVIDERPACQSNEYAVAVGWSEDARIRRVYEKRTVEPQPRKFSKLKIYGAVASLGAWERVKAWLEGKNVGGVNGWTAFQLAQEISEDHALFAPLAEEARQLLGLSEAQFNALLDSCILEN